jgi:lipopolysaccharide/colanic/teichoic acid biosynthesis glycosyltransferase
MNTENRELDEPAATSPVRLGRTSSRYESVKPWVDFAGALVMLLVSTPFILLCMVVVRLNSRGPSIYTQRRLGLGGKVFTIYKIRTMYHDSERDGPKWSLPGDSRITPVGRFLRWCHLDELPQLINVLKGQMSLIGPRPERPEFLADLERDLPDYRRRLTVRPGLTGLAQVQQPPDTSVSSVRRKLNYDLYYVDHLNPWLDFRLILGTVLKCLGVPFVRIGRILRLPDPNAQPGSESLLLEPGLAASSSQSRRGCREVSIPGEETPPPSVDDDEPVWEICLNPAPAGSFGFQDAPVGESQLTSASDQS